MLWYMFACFFLIQSNVIFCLCLLMRFQKHQFICHFFKIFHIQQLIEPRMNYLQVGIHVLVIINLFGDRIRMWCSCYLQLVIQEIIVCSYFWIVLYCKVTLQRLQLHMFALVERSNLTNIQGGSCFVSNLKPIVFS